MQLTRILLLFPDIVCLPAPVIAGELMPTEVSVHMRNYALVDRQKINSYHSIRIHTHASVESEYEVSNMEVEMEIHLAGCSNTKERQRTNG